MSAIRYRGVFSALVIASSILFVLFVLLPDQASATLLVGHETQASLEDVASSAYPGTPRINAADMGKEECETCENPPVTAVRPAAILDSGGPDEFGYTYIDSNEPGGPRYDFVDIRDSDNQLFLYDDGVSGPVDIGFPFPFYGENKTEFYVGANGIIGFAPDTMFRYYNDCPIVSPNLPHDIIALQWNDLYQNFDSSIQYQTFDSCPYGDGACLVVQYTDMYFIYGDPAGTFQAILFDSSDILLQFADSGTAQGAFSTTGIKNAVGTDGLTYACAETGSLNDDLAILFRSSGLQVAKQVSEPLPTAGQPITYSIAIKNMEDKALDAIIVDDLLPPDLLFRGPVTITPAHPEADLAQSEANLPRLVENLNLAAGELVTITLPTSLTTDIAGTRINRAIIADAALSAANTAEAALYVVNDCEQVADNVVQNCSFESGDLSGWQTTEIISPLLPIQVAGAGVDTLYGQFNSEPIRGDFAVVHGFDGNGPGDIELIQDLSLPDDATTVEFIYRVGYDMASYEAYEYRTFLVVIEPAGGGPYPLQESAVYVAEPGNILSDSGDQVGAVDVSKYAGMDVRLVFRWHVPETYSGPAMFQLDNIIARTASPPAFANAPHSHAQLGSEYVHLALTSDTDVGESRSIVATVRPSWLDLVDHGDGSATLSGTPQEGDVGEHPILLGVTDARGLAAEQPFTITVADSSIEFTHFYYAPTILVDPNFKGK